MLVQCNYGGADRLSVSPAYRSDEEIADLLPCRVGDAPNDRGVTRPCDDPGEGGEASDPEQGSIIVLVATDAPVMPHQLKRLAKRVSLGIGRTGGYRRAIHPATSFSLSPRRIHTAPRRPIARAWK